MAGNPANDTSGKPGGRTVGLLCGGGLLPLRVAESLRKKGIRVVAVAITGEADPGVESAADELHWTGLAKLGQWIRVFKDAGAEALLMCGGIQKQKMFNVSRAGLPDWRSVKLWYQQLRSREDHTILGAVAGEFEKEGIRVGSIVEYCPEMLITRGCQTKRRPTADQWRDIRFAWPVAKQIAALQIGQCIVVKDGAVIAVEGIDGTDATLARGGALAGGEAVAVKVPKEGHDVRFDIPCMGPDTVETLHEAEVAVMAVEAGGTVLLERDETMRKADEAGICIVACAPEDLQPDAS